MIPSHPKFPPGSVISPYYVIFPDPDALFPCLQAADSALCYSFFHHAYFFSLSSWQTTPLLGILHQQFC